MPTAEALLTLAGAETVSLRDAADDPVYEPEPSSTPLWPNVAVEALFAQGAELAAVVELLTTTFHGASVSVDALDDSAWQARLYEAAKPRPIGA